MKTDGPLVNTPNPPCPIHRVLCDEWVFARQREALPPISLTTSDSQARFALLAGAGADLRGVAAWATEILPLPFDAARGRISITTSCRSSHWMQFRYASVSCPLSNSPR